jgi:predicted naringenin-chalcone synthase
MIQHLELEGKEETKLRILYRASGIKTRYSVLPDFSGASETSFFVNGVGKINPSVSPRMQVYREQSIKLAGCALEKAINETHLISKDITHLITVSCTGMYAPGLDIDLIQKLGFATSVQRTQINFMGCYAAFNALKAANHIVESHPEAKVAVVCVELCSIHFQEKKDEDTLLANALFGDGAAAAIITSGGCSAKELEIKKYYSDLALQGKEEMTWNIGDLGFEMKLSGNVPGVIREGIDELAHRLLKMVNLSIRDIDFFAIHPGGKKILEVIEEKLQLTREDNRFARQVLQTYGNMSSPTILFVMKNILDHISQEDDQKNILSFAFGPGLTMESMVLKTHIR